MFCVCQRSRQLRKQAQNVLSPCAEAIQRWQPERGIVYESASKNNFGKQIMSWPKSPKGFSWLNDAHLAAATVNKRCRQNRSKIEKNRLDRRNCCQQAKLTIKVENEFGSLTSLKDPRPSLLIDASVLRRKKYDFEMFDEFIFIPFGVALKRSQIFRNTKIFVGSCSGFWLLR